MVAPSLIPRRAGDRVKTDRRDAGRLARLHRAGELTAIRVPAEAEEAVRDLVRARAALLADRKRARQRITAVLLRHGRAWRGTCWAAAHEQWIAAQRFGEPALASALAHYRAALDTRRAELEAVEDELAVWAARPLLAAAVARLGCYRGIAELNGLTLAAEVVDWRRFPSARAFMCFTGLVPAEYSQRRAHPPRPGHQSGLGRCPHGADRGGLVLPVPARDRRHLAPPPARRGPADPGSLLAGAAPAIRPLQGDDRPRQARRCRGHRDGPRAGRLRLGRDDQLMTFPEPVACRDARRRRNEPRAHYERMRDPRN